MGKIITFYSYRGGAGKTTTIVNIAKILSHKGYKVLIVDLDLETPSMHYYIGNKDKKGFFNLLLDYKEYMRDEHDDYEITLENFMICKGYIQTITDNISFVSAGEINPDYPKDVTSFDWDNFYKHWHGYGLFEAITEKWCEKYDYILIDSPSGFSSISGICTLQFPHTVLFFYHMNQQSIGGIKHIAKSVRNKSIGCNQKGVPEMHFIGAQINNSMPERKAEWENITSTELVDYIISDCVLSYIEKYQIPYSPINSYGDVMSDDVTIAHNKIVNELILKALIHL
jgi:hypothetical protein